MQAKEQGIRSSGPYSKLLFEFASGLCLLVSESLPSSGPTGRGRSPACGLRDRQLPPALEGICHRNKRLTFMHHGIVPSPQLGGSDNRMWGALEKRGGAHLFRRILEGRDLFLQVVQASAGQLVGSYDWKQKAMVG